MVTLIGQFMRDIHTESEVFSYSACRLLPKSNELSIDFISHIVILEVRKHRICKFLNLRAFRDPKLRLVECVYLS
jgi:hypothetical protein